MRSKVQVRGAVNSALPGPLTLARKGPSTWPLLDPDNMQKIMPWFYLFGPKDCLYTKTEVVMIFPTCQVQLINIHQVINTKLCV